MMSIGVVRSSMNLAKYFIDKDNYYLTDKSDIEKSALWTGKGAELLGIADKTVELKLFSQLLHGRLPDGQQIGLMRDGSINHRPATDLTFSAPKSFSIMALEAGDSRLTQVHNEAVKAVVKKIETLYAEARITKDGVTSYEKTDNLVVALFRHTSSREKDANLHTHAVTLNMTQRQDGQWRALSSRQKGDLANLDHGFRELIYANQHYLGAIYNSAIAKGAVDCGYGIRVVDKYGNFEIEGVSDDYIQAKSKRRTQILEEMDKRGVSGAKAAQEVTLHTRERKESISPEDLKAQWKKEAKEFGVDLDKIHQASLSPQNHGNIETKTVPLSRDAKEAVQDAIDHLSQYNAQIRHGDLIRQALSFGGNLVDHEALEQVLTEKIKDGDLIGKENNYYTTKALLETEKKLTTLVNRAKGTGFQVDVKHSGLAAETLKSPDRLQIIDVKGLKNEAKLINELVKTTEGQNFNTYVLHPNQSRVDYLTGSINRPNDSLWQSMRNFFKHDLLQTVGKFQHDYQHQIGHAFFDKKKDYVVVMDAQKLPYQDIERLATLSEAGQAKVIFLNNTESTQGFSAGSGIKLMKEAGLHNHRSSTPTKNTVVEIKETAKAQEDLAYQAAQNKNAAVVALTNKAQQSLTEKIRSFKKEAQELSVQEVKHATLSTRSLTPVEKKKIKSYHVGDQITLNPFKDNQKQYHISAIDKAQQSLELVDKEDQKITFSLSDSREFQVNKRQTLAIAKGEQLRATRALYLNRHEKIDKNSTFTVTDISNEGVRIQQGKTTAWLPAERLAKSYIDHGYVIKPHQLEKTEHALTALEGYQVNQNTIGEISEFANHVTLFTNHREKAEKALNEQKVSWIATEVAQGKPSTHYQPIVRTEVAIRSDLEKVANALSYGDKHKAQTAVSYGIAKLAEREAGFEMTSLLKESLKYAIGHATEEEITKIINEKVSAGELLLGNQYVTTPHVYELEQKILRLNQEGQGQVKPVFKATPAIDPKLTQGQKDAVSLALTTEDRFIGVQGLAGTGKTTMMKEIKKQAESQGYQLVGIAPTHKAVSKLDESINEDIKQSFDEAGVPVMTSHRFLREKLEGYNDKTIFITDESSMIGNRIFNDIQEKIIKLGARNIFGGDIGQQASIEGGKPFELSMKYGLKAAQMKEIVRQRNNPDLLQAAELAAARKSEASLRQIEKINPEDYIKRKEAVIENTESFIEVGVDKDDEGKEIYNGKEPSINGLYEAIANDYLTRVPEQRDNTIIVASRHKHRKEIDNLIREGLKKEGVIGEEIKTSRLKSKNLDQADLLHASNYEKGDILKFDRTFSIAKRGDHMTVLGINKKENTLSIKAEDGNQYTINPAKIALKSDLSVYEKLEVGIGVGDRVRLRMTDKQRGWSGGDEYTVSEVNSDQVTLKNDQKTLTINPKLMKDKHWDYAYTNTTFSVQGDGSKYFIGLEIDENFRSNYIQITRAFLHANIYTINKEDLIKYLNNAAKQQQANKTSAVEIIKGTHKEALAKKENQPQEKKIAGPELKDKPILASDIRPLLNQRVEELSIHLLGEPNPQLSSKTQLRFGSKGSLTINTQTAKWYSHENGESGGMFDLIQREVGLSQFKDVLKFAKDFLNYQPEKIKIESKVVKENNSQRNVSGEMRQNYQFS